MSESYPRQFEFQAEVLQRLTRIETNQSNDRKHIDATLKDLSERVKALEAKRVSRPRWFHITLGTGAIGAIGLAIKGIIALFAR